MAQRRSIIVLDQREREVLKAGTGGNELELVLRRLRKMMGEGLGKVEELSKARELDFAKLVEARQVLQDRLDLMRKLPPLDDPQLLAKAEQPITFAIDLCDRLAKEHFADEEIPEDARAAHEAGNTSAV